MGGVRLPVVKAHPLVAAKALPRSAAIGFQPAERIALKPHLERPVQILGTLSGRPSKRRHAPVERATQKKAASSKHFTPAP